MLIGETAVNSGTDEIRDANNRLPNNQYLNHLGSCHCGRVRCRPANCRRKRSRTCSFNSRIRPSGQTQPQNTRPSKRAVEIVMPAPITTEAVTERAATPTSAAANGSISGSQSSNRVEVAEPRNRETSQYHEAISAARNANAVARCANVQNRSRGKRRLASAAHETLDLLPPNGTTWIEVGSVKQARTHRPQPTQPSSTTWGRPSGSNPIACLAYGQACQHALQETPTNGKQVVSSITATPIRTSCRCVNGFNASVGQAGIQRHLVPSHAQVARVLTRHDVRRPHRQPGRWWGNLQDIGRTGIDALLTANTACQEVLFAQCSWGAQRHSARCCAARAIRPPTTAPARPLTTFKNVRRDQSIVRLSLNRLLPRHQHVTGSTLGILGQFRKTYVP